jgi:RND superfamily putative drug exporter
VSDPQATPNGAAQPLIPRLIRRLAVPVLLAWVALAAVFTMAATQLEEVGREHEVSLAPMDAPSLQAMIRIGEVFQEYDSSSSVMVVLAGESQLGDDAHAYYDHLIHELEQAPEHVKHIMDLWSNPLTAAGSQSNDGKAAYVQVFLAGNQGDSESNESVEAVREIVAALPPPPGIEAHVTGPAALSSDLSMSGDKSMVRMMAITLAVIAIMLFIVYRSIVTTVLVLVTVGITMSAARGVVGFLGHHEIIKLSTFATALLTSLAIAAATDYAIFLIGRYQEAREAGEDPETAYYTAYQGSAHVILGSGLTIAGATFCLVFTRLPYFQTMGIPSAVGLVVVVLAATTLGPAVLVVGTRFGLFEPRRTVASRSWRRVGTAVVRWPGPILIATCAASLIGLVALPSYTPNYDDRLYMPADTPANIGYTTAAQHFSQARLNPDMLLVEADHDMRNPGGMLVLDKIAKAVSKVAGIDRVQSITRPLGSPIEHSSIPFQISLQNAITIQNMTYLKDRMADMLKMADQLTITVGIIERMHRITEELSDTTHATVESTRELQAHVDELRDQIANVDDFFRPIRNYFYWEPHCVNIPICWSLRSLFDALDGVDKLSDDARNLTTNLTQLDALMPQMVTEFPAMIDTMTAMRASLLTMYSTFNTLMNQIDELSKNATVMGQAFDAAKNDDMFYLPPEVFDNPQFQFGLKMFLSPDGKAARFIITHKGDPATLDGISRTDPIRNAAQQAVNGTPLGNAHIQLAGTAATYKDMQDGAKYDLMIAALAALSLIFMIMLVIIRALVAAFVIVFTVALSLGASFGLAVLIWQGLLGIQLHWLVFPMAVIILLAVGSDYNLLLVSRFKQEIHAGLNTGIIRSMAGTGKVVTAAGLVFAFTMGSMVSSDLRVIGQLGTTICLGLLFDTLIVRSFMTPSIAALLGRWFWWPQTYVPDRRRRPSVKSHVQA